MPILGERQFRNGGGPHPRVLRPGLVEFHERAENFLEGVAVSPGSDEKRPRLLVIAGGRQRAASNKLRRISGETAVSEKARGLQRSRIRSWTGYCVAAGLCICFLLRISKAGITAGGAFSLPGYTGCGKSPFFRRLGLQPRR